MEGTTPMRKTYKEKVAENCKFCENSCEPGSTVCDDCIEKAETNEEAALREIPEYKEPLNLFKK
jgi:hypothetical protein